jgi:hypothetical protein
VQLLRDLPALGEHENHVGACETDRAQVGAGRLVNSSSPVSSGAISSCREVNERPANMTWTRVFLTCGRVGRSSIVPRRNVKP